MKTSFFTAMGLLALAGLGATNPVAQGGGTNNMPMPESANNKESGQSPPGSGRGRGGLQGSRSKQQQQYIFFCKAGGQGDIGQICQQCQGTPVEDPSCAPALQGCKVQDDTCFTDQKCQQEYGQEAKAQQCGKQQNNQLLGTNKQQGPKQQPRPKKQQRPKDSNMAG